MAYHNFAIILNFIFITKIVQPTANHRPVASTAKYPFNQFTHYLSIYIISPQICEINVPI